MAIKLLGAWRVALAAARSHHAKAAKSYQALAAEGSGPLILLASAELDLAHGRVLRALEGLELCQRTEVLEDLDRGRRPADRTRCPQCQGPKQPGVGTCNRARCIIAAETPKGFEAAEKARAEAAAARTCPQCQGLKQADEATCRWESCEKAEDATEAR
jgi:hypothetical protein